MPPRSRHKPPPPACFTFPDLPPLGAAAATALAWVTDEGLADRLCSAALAGNTGGGGTAAAPPPARAERAKAGGDVGDEVSVCVRERRRRVREFGLSVWSVGETNARISRRFAFLCVCVSPTCALVTPRTHTPQPAHTLAPSPGAPCRRTGQAHPRPARGCRCRCRCSTCRRRRRRRRSTALSSAASRPPGPRQGRRGQVIPDGTRPGGGG